MLKDIYLGRDHVSEQTFDGHRHATFSCGWSRLLRAVGRLWTGRA